VSILQLTLNFQWTDNVKKAIYENKTYTVIWLSAFIKSTKATIQFN